MKRFHLLSIGWHDKICLKCGFTILHDHVTNDERIWLASEENCAKVHAPYKPAMKLAEGGNH